ncbi:MAG: TetR/AcrR family transcriptional regulator C-terminal domain-containing protein [Ilumatobacteraceae bacterium]
MATRRTLPRETLSRHRVLQAAVTMADEQGVGALSMRALGQRLQVEAMSLYNHVANKDDVLDGIVDLVVEEISPPAAVGDWRACIRTSALSAHEVLNCHPWACSLWLQRYPGPARIRYMEGLLACLGRSRLPHDVAHHAYHVIDTYIVGFTAQQHTFVMGVDQLESAAAEFLEQLSPTEFPHVVEHVHEHLSDEPSANTFEFGLDLILDGLGRLGRTHRGPRRT